MKTPIASIAFFLLGVLLPGCTLQKEANQPHGTFTRTIATYNYSPVKGTNSQTSALAKPGRRPDVSARNTNVIANAKTFVKATNAPVKTGAAAKQIDTKMSFKPSNTTIVKSPANTPSGKETKVPTSAKTSIDPANANVLVRSVVAPINTNAVAKQANAQSPVKQANIVPGEDTKAATNAIAPLKASYAMVSAKASAKNTNASADPNLFAKRATAPIKTTQVKTNAHEFIKYSKAPPDNNVVVKNSETSVKTLASIKPGDMNVTVKNEDTKASLKSTGTNASVQLESMETLDDTHRLAIGDRLIFRIQEDKHRLELADKLSARSEDEPIPLLVTDSGELEVPYIGLFPAEAKTCKRLAYELKAALEKDYFYKATVILAVDLKTRSRGRVYLTGAVHMPGPQEIPSDEILTLGKAILRAGGFTDFAERRNVKVTRKAKVGSSETKTLIVDVAQVFDKGRTDLDLPLEPGDLIMVSERLVRF